MDARLSTPIAFLLLLLLHTAPLALCTGADGASTPPPTAGATEIVRRALARRCADNYTVTCLKMDVVSLVDRLSRKDSYEILPSVAVVRAETGERAADAGGPQLPKEVVRDLARGLPEAGDSAAVRRLDDHLLARMDQYMDTHAVSLNLAETGAAARSLGEQLLRTLGLQTHGEGGRKGGGGGFGGGKKGGLGMLGAMMIMSKATVGAIAMGGLALLAGKALIVGLLSLLLSAIVGIKALSSSKGGGSVTYEIVQKPVYSHAHSHSHEEIHSGGHGHGGGGGGGYRRRSYDVADAAAHDLAYSSYLPQGSGVVASGGVR